MKSVPPIMALLVIVPGVALAAPDETALNDARGSESVIVTGERLQYVPEVPGGTAVVTAAELQAGSIANLEDALKFVPGLFAQSVSGGEGTRLSIRGSGITKGGFTWGNGVQILFDGLPLSSPLGTPYESFEPNAYSRIEVYKGANAFEYGATQLGGVLNFVQHTGHDSAPLFLRAEGGSYGYNREQVSSGQAFGPLDYYVSLTHFSTDGYLRHSSASSDRLIGNVGYEITDSLKTRFYFEFADQYQENINSVTLTQLLTSPRLNPNSPNGSRTNHGSLFVANKTNYQIDEDSSLEFGFQYKRPPLHNGNEPQRTYWDTSDWAASLKYRRHDELFGHDSNTTLAFLPSAVIGGSGATVTNSNTGAVLGHVKYGGSNITLLVSNDLQLAPDLWLLTGVAGIWQTRSNLITNAIAPGVDPSLHKSYGNVTPRVGFRYDFTPQVQFYGNISRLIEAPQIISYAASAAGAYTGYVTTSGGQSFNSRNLTVQAGTSYEIGTRGSRDWLTWDIDYYNEQLRNELLTIFAVLPTPANPNGVSFTENAPPTVHEGIEAAVSAELWRGDEGSVGLRQAYAWNNFRFAHQAAQQHILPGLPRQTYQAELEFRHQSGLYATLGVNAVLTRYPVDYANQAFAPAYTLLGASLGYAPTGANWRVFIQGDNLTAERYASFTSATGIANASSAVYTPGVGPAVSAGVTYAFQ